MAAAAAPAEHAPPAPLHVPPAIHRLDDAVVHRIAAGEVVQRPASALKEMVENSLDAGAKHITVVVKEGGLKYLQIQDDGCGIRLDDLPILCHRHTTSKLRAFEDLETISTLGFRGEALASISYVSHVTVTTMTRHMQHGYRVQYSDGEVLPPGPKPVAAVPGTSIIVEDMFYNMLPRRRAFKPGPEEHNLLADVLQRYAVYKAGAVGFTLKRQGEARSDLHTLPSACRLDVIRSLYGPDLAASLLPLPLTRGGSGDTSAAVTLDGPMGFSVQGFVSNLTHVGRRSVLILFINGRPVEQGQLRRAIEAVYTAHNPKANKPWVFLDLLLPPRHVEVNMHPTKREVGFLHQQAVIDDVCRAVEQVLTASMHTRTFTVNRPVALAAAGAAGGGATQQQPAAAADGDGDDGGDAEMADADAADSPQQPQRRSSSRQGSDGPLKPLNGAQSKAGAAARSGSGGSGGGSGGGPSQALLSKPTQQSQQQQQQSQQPAYYRPEKLVRTDHRTQSIEGFLVSTASAAATAAAAGGAAGAAGGGGSIKRRKSSAAAAAGAAAGVSVLLGGGSSSQGVDAGATGEGVDDGGGAFGPDGLFSNASLHLQAAAAEEAAAAAELAAAAADGSASQKQQQQQQQQQNEAAALLRPVAQPRLPAVVTQLSSIWELLGEVEGSVHGELQALFKSHTWVGMADHQLALLQHGTRLYLVNMCHITRDLFYQLLLVRWEAPEGVVQLRTPLHVGALMRLALQQEEAAGRWKPEPGSSCEELCELVQALLGQKADMLREYVGLSFAPAAAAEAAAEAAAGDAVTAQQQQSQQQQQQEKGAQPQQAVPPPSQQQQQPQQQLQQQQQPSGLYLTGLPLLLQGYLPDLSRLPALVLALARDVDWDTERECFRSLAAALADFYALQPLLPVAVEAAGAGAAEVGAQQQQQQGAAAAARGGGGEEQRGAAAEPMDVDGQQQQQQSTPQAQAAAAAGAAANASNPCSSSSLMLQAGHRSQAQREWLLRHVVMPAVKAMYRPSHARARDGSVLLLTSMEKLYRVFERCGW